MRTSPRPRADIHRIPHTRLGGAGDGATVHPSICVRGSALCGGEELRRACPRLRRPAHGGGYPTLRRLAEIPSKCPHLHARPCQLAIISQKSHPLTPPRTAWTAGRWATGHGVAVSTGRRTACGQSAPRIAPDVGTARDEGARATDLKRESPLLRTALAPLPRVPWP